MKDFNFNKNEVCLNPNQYVVIQRKDWCSNYATIITFKKNSKWQSGINVAFNRFGCSLTYSKEFDSEKESYIYSKNKIQEYLRVNIKTDAENAIISKSQINYNHFPETLQLAFF